MWECRYNAEGYQKREQKLHFKLLELVSIEETYAFESRTLWFYRSVEWRWGVQING